MNEPLVTDKQAEAWRERYENSASRNIYSAPIVRALLGSRAHTWEILEQARRTFEFLIDDGTGIDSRLVDAALARIVAAQKKIGRHP